MASGQGVLNYIDVTDFSAGIVRGWRSGGQAQSGEMGAAQQFETWGCVGPPSGGLEPAPRRVQDQQIILWANSTPSSPFPTAVRIHDVLAAPGYYVNQNTMSSGFWTGAPSGRSPDVVTLVTSHYANLSGVPQYYYQTGMYYGQTLNFTFLDTRNLVANVARPPLYGAGWATWVQSRDGQSNFMSHLTNPGAPQVDPESPFYNMCLVTSQTWFHNNLTGSDSPNGRRTMVYPDPVSGSLNPRTYGGAAVGSGASDADSPHVWRNRQFTHQGRLGWTSTHTSSQKLGTIPEYVSPPHDFYTYIGDDQLRYHGVNEIQTASAEDFLNLDAGGQLAMVGAVGSLNSNTLLMVMSNGGGIVVSGALDLNPGVARYPRVQSTGFNSTHSAMTPLGMVYGTADGVYAWGGGETAQLLSPQLDGRFWVNPAWAGTTRCMPDTPMGRFAWQAPFLYAPYNWIMDSRTNGWWRISETQETNASAYDLGHFTASGTGSVWGAPLEQARGASDTRVLHRFNTELGAPSWSWRSQPFAIGRNRSTRVREVNFVAQASNATSTLEVSVIGDNVTETKTITLSSGTRPIYYRIEFDTVCHDPQIRIRANSQSGSVDGPRVYRMSVGFREERSV
jgi:hypothetical protein